MLKHCEAKPHPHQHRAANSRSAKDAKNKPARRSFGSKIGAEVVGRMKRQHSRPRHMHTEDQPWSERCAQDLSAELRSGPSDERSADVGDEKKKETKMLICSNGRGYTNGGRLTLTIR